MLFCIPAFKKKKKIEQLMELAAHCYRCALTVSADKTGSLKAGGAGVFLSSIQTGKIMSL